MYKMLIILSLAISLFNFISCFRNKNFSSNCKLLDTKVIAQRYELNYMKKYWWGLSWWEILATPEFSWRIVPPRSLKSIFITNCLMCIFTILMNIFPVPQLFPTWVGERSRLNGFRHYESPHAFTMGLHTKEPLSG